jgi:hypothetical protein
MGLLGLVAVRAIFKVRHGYRQVSAAIALPCV